MVTHNTGELVEHLRSRGWNFQPRGGMPAADVALPDLVPGRYSEFLSSFAVLANGSDDVWFLSIEDYAGSSDSAFSWDEFRTMSLESAGCDEEAARIDAFWSRCIPIMMMVGDRYAYLGIDTVSGAVVHGAEPEFEQVSTVAADVDELFRKVLAGESVHGFFDRCDRRSGARMSMGTALADEHRCLPAVFGPEGQAF